MLEKEGVVSGEGKGGGFSGVKGTVGGKVEEGSERTVRNCELLKGLSGLKDIRESVQVWLQSFQGWGPGNWAPSHLPERGSAVIQP